jgi:hypothetical protein
MKSGKSFWAVASLCLLPRLAQAEPDPARPRFEASDAALTRVYACLDVLTAKLAGKPAVWGSLYHVAPTKSSFADGNATFWGWDSVWALAALLPEMTEPARVYVLKTLEHQREDGEVPTSLNHHRVSYYWNGANAFLVLMVSELLRYEGRPDLLRATVGGVSVYEREKRACEWYRRYLWDEAVGLYRNHGHGIEDDYASFDTTWDSTSDYRGGPDRKNNDFWCDFNTYYALMHREMAWHARLMGDLGYAAEQEGAAERLTAAIEARLWNPAVGMFTDLDEAGGMMAAKHAGGIETALILMRHVPELVKHLDDPAEFRLPFGIPGLSRDHPSFDPTDSGDHTHGTAMPHHNPRWFQLLLEQGYEETARHGLSGWMRGKKFDRNAARRLGAVALRGPQLRDGGGRPAPVVRPQPDPETDPVAGPAGPLPGLRGAHVPATAGRAWGVVGSLPHVVPGRRAGAGLPRERRTRVPAPSLRGRRPGRRNPPPRLTPPGPPPPRPGRGAAGLPLVRALVRDADPAERVGDAREGELRPGALESVAVEVGVDERDDRPAGGQVLRAQAVPHSERPEKPAVQCRRCRGSQLQAYAGIHGARLWVEVAGLAAPVGVAQ